jgi:hypothetical protein
MKSRTLVAHQRYFGLEAMRFREAANRVLARVVGLPVDRAQVHEKRLREDFAVTTQSGQCLVEDLVRGGLLKPHGGRPGEFRLTDKFAEFAYARIIAPLPRARARQLLERVAKIAAHINASWSRNPLEIEMVAVSGAYMSRDDQLGELTLNVLVRNRAQMRSMPWGRRASKAEGANEIRGELGSITTFAIVHLLTDRQTLPRPFNVVYSADG